MKTTTEIDDFIIAQKPIFTIKEYKDSVNRKNDVDKKIIATAIKRRLIQRYITPNESKEFKNGFSIIANCCLLIESYESFIRGWSKTPSSSDAFCKFFNRSKLFSEFTENDTPTEFYKNIRCGILHQGETTGGWRIQRKLKQKLDLKNKIIDANHFRNDLKKEIEDYFDSLTVKDWNTNEWKMLIKKMNSIIKNCKK